MSSRLNNRDFLMDMYSRLYREWGPQGWWPAESRLEVIVGAILTQAVSWSNVEQAIEILKQNDALSQQALEEIPHQVLARMIRPAGYYNVKARKLKAFLTFLNREFGGDLDALFHRSLPDARRRLLDVYGIGPETADSILLYAGGHPTFVIDAYTRRIISRVEDSPEPGYETLRRIFLDNLPREMELYREYHALLVRLGRECCRKTTGHTLCPRCPVRTLCRSADRTG